VYRFLHRVRDVVGAKGGGVGGFGAGPGYLCGSEGRIVLILREADNYGDCFFFFFSYFGFLF